MSATALVHRTAAHTARRRPAAIVYCDGSVGTTDGTTANGLDRAAIDRRRDRRSALRRAA
jgi:hypothetical protein